MEININNKVLADKVRVYRNFFLKAKGLRFSRKLRKGEALILVADKESISQTTIDMLFVFFPIDVLWLNSKKEVVDLKENVRPFSLATAPKKAAKYVVELPKGKLKNIKIGEKVIF